MIISGDGFHQRLQATLQTTYLLQGLQYSRRHHVHGEAEDARLPKPSVGRLVPKQARTISGIGALDQP